MSDNSKLRLLVEADESASASRIVAQLPTIERLVNSRKRIKLNLELDHKTLESQLQSVVKNGIKPLTAELKVAQAELDRLANQNALETFWKRNTKAHSSASFVQEFQRVYRLISDLNTPLSQATKELSRFEEHIRSAASTGRSFGTEIKEIAEHFSRWLGISEIGAQVKSSIELVIETVDELDQALVDLQTTTGKSRTETSALLREYSQLAKELGTTTAAISASANELLRQGRTAAEAGALIRESMLLSKAGQLENAAATKQLTSAMQSYKKEAEGTLGTLDKLSAAQMQSTASAGESTPALGADADTTDAAIGNLENYQSEVESKRDQTAAAFKELATSILGSELVDGSFDPNTGILGFLNSLLEKTGSIPELFSSGAAKSTGGIFGVQQNLEKQSGSEFTMFGKSFSQLKDTTWGRLDVNVIQKYRAELEKGASSQTAYYRALTQSDGSLKKVNEATLKCIESGRAAKMTSEQIAAAQKNVGISGKVAAVGMNLLATAGSMLLNMGISFAINLIVQGISSLVHAEEEAREKALEAANAYKEQADGLEEYKTQIFELKDALESGNLSQEEAYNARQKLLGIQDEIIKKYGLEADAINLLKMSTDETNDALGAASKKSAAQFLAENAEAIKKAKDQMESEYSTGRNKSLNASGSHHQFFKWDQEATGAEKVLEILKKYKNIRFYQPSKNFSPEKDFNINDLIEGGEYHFEITGSWAEAKETAHGLLTDLKELQQNGVDVDKMFGNEYADITGLDDSFKPVIETLDYWAKDHEEIYNKAIEAQIISTDEYRNVLGKAEEAQSAFTEAVAAGDKDAAKNALSSFDQIFQELDIDNISDVGVKNYFKKFKSDFEKIAKDYKLELDIETDLSPDAENKEKIETLVKDTQNAFEDASGEVDINKLLDIGQGIDNGTAKSVSEFQKKVWEDLKQQAHTYGVEVEDLVKKFIDLGQIKGLYSGQAEANISRFKTQISGLSNESEILTKALEEQNKTGTLSLSTVETLTSSNSAYASALERSGRGIVLNQEKLDSLRESTIANTKAEVEEQRQLTADQWSIKAKAVLELQKGYAILDADKKQTLSYLEKETAALAESISKYDILIAQLDEMSNGYKKWMEAKNRTDSGEIFNEAEGAYKTLKEGFSSGKVGTNAFKGATEFLIPEDVQAQGLKATENYLSRISGLFEEGIPGIEAFWQMAEGRGLAERNGENSWQFKPGISIEDLAEELNLTEDMVIAKLGEMEDYGAEFDFGTDEEAIEKIQALLDANQKLNSITDKNSDEYKKAYEDVLKATEAVANLPKEQLTKYHFDFDPEAQKLTYNSEEVQKYLSTQSDDKVTVMLNEYNTAWDNLQKALASGHGVMDAATRLDELKEGLLGLPDAVKEANQITEATINNGTAGIGNLINQFHQAIQARDRLAVNDEGSAEWKKQADEADRLFGIIKTIAGQHTELGINTDTLEEDLKNNTFDLEGLQAKVQENINTVAAQLDAYEQRKKALETDPIKLGVDTSAAKEEIAKLQLLIDELKSGKVTIPVSVVFGGILSPSENTPETTENPENPATQKSAPAPVRVPGSELMSNPKPAVQRPIGESKAKLSPAMKSGTTLDSQQPTEIQQLDVPASIDTNYSPSSVSGGMTIYQPSSTSKKPQKKGSSSAKKGDSKSAKDAAQEELRYYQHLRKMELLSDKEYYRELERIVNTYYKGNKELLSEYYSGLEELYELQKSIHKDWLSDQEHKVFLLDKNDGTDSAKEQVSIYRSMQESVAREAASARERGLGENDDYIQELQKQWWDYEDKITDLYKKIADAYIDEMERVNDWQEADLKRRTSMWDFLFDEEPETVGEARTQVTSMMVEGNKIVDEANRQQARAHAGAEEKKGLIHQILADNGIEWDGSLDDIFTIDGDVNEGVLAEFLSLFDGLPNGDELKEQVRGYVEGIGIDKASWYNAEKDKRSTVKDIETAQDNLRKREKDAISEVESMILARKQKELDAIEEIHDKTIESLEDQLDAVNELYDRRIEALNDLKEKEDYQKSLNKETDTLNDIQAQIDKYSLIDTEAARTKVRELKEQLAEQQEKIDEMENDRHHQDLIDALEKDREAQQDAIGEQIDLENEKYEETLKLMDERYSAEKVHNEALLALQTGYFNEFVETADMSYDTITSGAQTSAVEMGKAFENFKIETNGYFDEMADGPILDSIENWHDLEDAILSTAVALARLKDDAGLASPDLGNNGVDESVEDQGKAHEENDKKLQENAAYAKSELERTLVVIANRKAYGLDISAQEAYLRRICEIHNWEIPKYHTGFLPSWIRRGEKLALLKDDETVLTRGMMEQFLSQLRAANFFGQTAPNLIREGFGPLSPAAMGGPASLSIAGDLIHIEGNADEKMLPQLRRIADSITYKIQDGYKKSR